MTGVADPCLSRQCDERSAAQSAPEPRPSVCVRGSDTALGRALFPLFHLFHTPLHALFIEVE
jgi:hypothetical protein